MRIQLPGANSFGLTSLGSSHLVRLLGDWSGSGETLHGQLRDRLHNLMINGAISSGTRLPSERSLAVALDVSRNTVAKAFDALKGDGLLVTRQGDGTYVSVSQRHKPSLGDDRLRSFSAESIEGRDVSIDLRSAALPGLAMVADEINLLDGSRMRSLIASHGYIPAGLPELREAIAQYYSALGLPTGAERILVTSGAQQALRLVAASFVRPGDVVAVEEPSFRGALESLKSIGARLVGVPSGVDGIDVDALAATVAKTRPALLVVQSTTHNPTGSVMDAFRRSRVASIANRYDLPVIDDATLADTIIDGERRPLPLAAGGDNIVTVGSMSKSFWGGLRVGWVRARADTVERLATMKGGEDLGTSLLAQLLAAQLLPQIEKARDERHAVLSESRRAVVSALAEELPEWQPQMPAGGASLWVKLPVARATAFVQHAERRGIKVLPGPTFSSTDQLENYLRLAFAGPLELTLRGITLLSDAWRRFDTA